MGAISGYLRTQPGGEYLDIVLIGLCKFTNLGLVTASGLDARESAMQKTVPIHVI